MVEDISDQLAKAIEAVRRSKDAKDASTFHGRGRTRRLQREVNRLRIHEALLSADAPDQEATTPQGFVELGDFLEQVAHEDATDQDAVALVEPVAWMYKSPFGAEITRFRWCADEGLTSDHWVGWTETALYPATVIERLQEQLAESQSEREEQARLLGMSGSREARLRAQLAQAEADKAEMMEAFAKCCEDWIAGYEDDEDGAKFRLLIKDYRRAFATLAKHRKAS